MKLPLKIVDWLLSISLILSRRASTFSELSMMLGAFDY